MDSSLTLRASKVGRARPRGRGGGNTREGIDSVEGVILHSAPRPRPGILCGTCSTAGSLDPVSGVGIGLGLGLGLGLEMRGESVVRERGVLVESIVGPCLFLLTLTRERKLLLKSPLDRD